MMADMIANLIVNRKNHAIVPPLDDNSTDNINHGEMMPHRPKEGDKHQESFPGLKGSLSTGVATMSSGIEREDARKISALGSVFPQSGQDSSADFSKSSGIHLSADGQFRRDVLFAIMERGMRGSNVIAKGAATAARRAIQAMDRKRAIALMNDSAIESENFGYDVPNDGSPGSILGLNERNNSGITINASIDEGEVMEALRLLIIQNQVAQENLSSENAVKAKGLTEVGADMPDRSRQDAMQDLGLYKRFNPNTDEYKYIMSLETQLWHSEHPSSNLLHSRPIPCPIRISKSIQRL